MKRLVLVTLLLCAQTPAQVESAQGQELSALGFGRSRLRVVLNEREAVSVHGDMVEMGRLGFLDRWLQEHLSRRIKGIESVDVLDRILSRTGARGVAATRERFLEIVGKDDAVKEAGTLLDSILHRRHRRFAFKAWMAWRPTDAINGAAPLVRLATERDIERRLAELSREPEVRMFPSEGVELLGGREARISAGVKHSYVRDYKAVGNGAKRHFNPVVDSINEGFEWRVGAMRLPGSGELVLDVDLKVQLLAKPMSRLEGRLGPGPQLYVIERPRISSLRWESGSLSLQQGQIGFIVRGLGIVDPDAGEDAMREIELICRLESLDDDGKPRGVVQGFDAEARIAFIKPKGRANWKIGQGVTVTRNGREVAKGKVRERLGGIVTATIAGGEVKAGDTVR